MDKNILNGKKNIHFIGIGGSGMYPIAQILLERGYRITGSDVNEGSIIDALRASGVAVSMGHDAKNVEGADAVIYTAALLPGNPELERAHELGITCIPRADALGLVSSGYENSICVAGTHGKTTTTAMLTKIFLDGGVDVSAVIGGKLADIGGYGRVGKSDVMVCEACEFKDTFLHLSPAYSVILNVDADHLDYFKTFDGVVSSFKRFASMASKGVIANGDDEGTLRALEGCTRPVKLFGCGSDCCWRAENIRRTEHARYAFDLVYDGGRIDDIVLGIPGKHNVYNALAAAACALSVGVAPEKIKRGIAAFKGAGRRFEMLGQTAKGAVVADDYAHHPAEIAATLRAAKEMGFERVIAVFQPFTFSRTKLLLNDFAEALKLADITVMTEIMGGREINDIGIYTKDLAALIDGSVWYEGFDGVTEWVKNNAGAGDLVITLGCGDIYKAAKMMIK